ncbi:MAG: zf-HC2 domain-containing protein [Longimicrobiales bacterium]
MKRKSIPCNVVMQRLWAFIDGELDTSSGEAVREHLEMCRRCYPRYDFQRAYFRLMERTAAEPEPAELRSRIFQVLLAETE